jgi:hypothetical protein
MDPSLITNFQNSAHADKGWDNQLSVSYKRIESQGEGNELTTAESKQLEVKAMVKVKVKVRSASQYYDG